MSTRPTLKTCLSPALLHLYDTNNKVVVIIDVFRATSTIATALDNGAVSVIPVASVAECIAIGSSNSNYITAGERDGRIADGLQYGNSPAEYPKHFIAGKSLVLTTTNGTRLLHMIQGAAAIITGSFLNLNAVCNFLISLQKPVILGCAGWKDRFNLEDTLFAGAVAAKLKDSFTINCDSTRAALYLHNESKGNYISFLKDSSHYQRLAGYGLEKDMEYCTTPNLHPVVPILKEKELVAFKG